MIILDTNIVSEFSRKTPDKRVFAWLARQQFGDLATCSPVIAELDYGAHRVLKRDNSDRYLASMERVIDNVVERRVFDFDFRSARTYGELRASEELAGRPKEQFDLMIAAICIANGATLATRNAADFAGLDLKVVNPFEPG